MPEERTENLAETDRGSYCNEENGQKNSQTTKVHFTMVVKVIMMMRTWKYNTRRNVNSDFSIVTMRRVAIIFLELGVVKKFMQKF